MAKASREVEVFLHPSIHPCMALQPFPPLGLVHKTPPFVPIYSWSEASLRFSEHRFFSRVGSSPHAQPPTSRTRVSLFVWAITFDLSGLGDPASSCATAGIALRIIWPHKPHHYVKVGTPSGGGGRGRSPLILNFGGMWRSVVSIMPQPVYLLTYSMEQSPSEANWFCS